MSSGIRLADESDIPALCDIWRSCFPDPDDYIRLFYTRNFGRISVPVFEVDGRPVSMLHLMDASISADGGERESKFIYAVGTLPEYRRKGYSGSLLQYVKNGALCNDHGLFLKPSSCHMSEYYRSFGFETSSWFGRFTISPGEMIPVTAASLSAEEYNRRRDAFFSGSPYVRWSDGHVRWCVEDNAYFGGETLALTMRGREFFMMCSPENGELLITETDMTPDELKLAGRALCGMFGARLIRTFAHDTTCRESGDTVASAVFNTDVRGAYVNLILI